MLKVIKPGVYTTIQDEGRKHYRAYGVPVSGVLDHYAFQKANVILGNPKNAAVIEIIRGGAEFQALQSFDLSIAGADMSAKLDGECIRMWSIVQIKKGQHLTFKGAKAGTVTYIALPGGVQSNDYLGSQSIYEKAGFGRPFQKEDIVYSKRKISENYTSIYPMEIPTYINDVTVNVVPSHFEKLFKQEAVESFYREPLTVHSSDRMAMLLKGQQPLQLKRPTDVVSEAVTFGTIQVPPSGQPMILLSDSQTTGGYPTIGHVHSKDLWRIVQLPPKGSIQFKRMPI